MEVLRAENLTKSFDKFVAVDDVSFSLKEGEILGLLGPNGAGKTTTLQMLLGILTPSFGKVFYFGKGLDEHREEIMERVNFSSTYTNLPWNLTVWECLTFVSYLYDIDGRSKRVKEIMDIFRLTGLSNAQIRDLSAGQLTRVNLAKAFVNFPKVLLLDEPTASLDPEVAKYIREFLLNERKKFQVSIVLTSHNMAEIEQVCDRVIFIDEGKIIADDIPANLSRTIRVAHVELLIRDNAERAAAYCREKGLKCAEDGKYLRVDINEAGIAEFLRGIMEQGLIYDEISIDKPTLEDYFLEVTHKSISEKI